jgi:urea transport system permease protein
VPSILMVCWVAVGGRGTVWGAVLGALVVNWGRTKVSEARPDDWIYVQGLLFIVVLAFAPGGILGAGRWLWAKRPHRGRATVTSTAASAAPSTTAPVAAYE